MSSRRDGFVGRRLSVAIDGGNVALLRFGCEGAPPLLFAHANGFCASAYRRMFEALGGAFDIFAVDLRGHGKTRLPARSGDHPGMSIFGEDLRQTKAALEALCAPGANWVLSGHSLGSVAAVIAAAGDPRIAALRLIEPVAMPASWNLMTAMPVWPLIAPRLPLVRGAARRRRHWPDRKAAFESYAGKRFFSGWAEGVLADYLADGLVEDETGAGLACAPAWEAATFAAQSSGFWRALARVRVPIGILAARHPTSTLRGDALARFRRLGAKVDMVEGLSHLAPFENPERAARFLAAAP